MRKFLTLTAAAALVALSVGFAAPANAIDLSAGLIGYWPFDDGADPTDDASVNANTGDVNGAAFDSDAADIAPISGNVSSLDFAAGDFVRVTDTTDLEPTDVSVSVWVRNNGTPTTFDYILAKTVDINKAAYALYTSDNGGLFFYASNAVDFFLSEDAGPGIWDGSWHHIAGIYDSSVPTVQLFVDGVEVGTPNAGPAAISYAETGFGNFTIGTYDDCCGGLTDWIGNIDEVRVYDRVLTNEEIEALASGGTLVIADPTDDAPDNIDIASVEISEDGTDLTCVFNLDETGTGGLLNKSTFRCHIDFDDEENSAFAGKGCNLADDTPYRLGTNQLCTTSDITMTYRPTKRGGKCTGLPNIICVEEETDGDGDTDALCNGKVGGDDAVSCTITITGSLADIATVWDAQCDGESECLTTITDRTNDGEFDVFMFFDSQLKSDRDRVPDTDDNNKPNVLGEVVDVTLPDGS